MKINPYLCAQIDLLNSIIYPFLNFTSMKKLFLTLCVALFSVGAFAQEKGDMVVGGSLNFNTDASMIGVGPKFQYFIIDNLCGEAEAVYYFKKDGVDMWTALASAHYLFNVADKFAVYPIAGLGFAHSSASASYYDSNGHNYSVSASSSDFIGQAGGGAQYFFTDKIGANIEAKYQFGHGGAFVLGAGILFKF